MILEDLKKEFNRLRNDKTGHVFFNKKKKKFMVNERLIKKRARQLHKLHTLILIVEAMYSIINSYEWVKEMEAKGFNIVVDDNTTQ